MQQKEEKQKDGLIYEKMKKFISIIDELRDFGLQTYISLPRIAVLGLQSAGKSSLLESIVGYDFLPRGEGIVTRRPLELRLVHAVDVNEPYGIFDKISKDKITDFPMIRQKIAEYTDKDAGVRKGILETPLVLTIYSKNLPDLSLVDLPGITKVPVKNSDHPDNIEEVTTELCLKYIKDPRTIILCVVQANLDISTSDALKIAKTHDKNGERTLCALTKVDMIDKGSDIRAILNNDEVVLKYGYVAIKNRNPQDIKDNVSVSTGLKNEDKFFMASYPDLMDQGVVGTNNLVKKLSVILSKNINSSLPTILKELKEKIDLYEGELKTLGNPLPEQDSEKIQLVLSLVNNFCTAYQNSIKGKYIKVKKEEKDLVSVAIRSLLLEIFKDIDDKKIEGVLTNKLIKGAFVNYGASGLPGFPPYAAFQKLLTPLLRDLVPKSNDLVDRVYFLLEKNIQDLIDQIFLRFPELKSTISDCALKILNKCKKSSEELVDQLMEAELMFLYTSDEDYLSSHGSILPKITEKNKDDSMADAFVTEIRERVKDYFKLVYRNLRDSIPKAIGQMLLNESSDKMQIELYEGVNKDTSSISKTLSEPEIILLQRKQCNQALKILKNCLKRLQDEDLIEDID